MKKVVGVMLLFVAAGFALDLLGVHGTIPRTVLIATMISSLGYVASREFGSTRRPPK